MQVQIVVLHIRDAGTGKMDGSLYIHSYPCWLTILELQSRCYKPDLQNGYYLITVLKVY